MATSEAKHEAKPAVILVGSDKGGVGKTTVTRTLLDYYRAKKVPTSAYDTSPHGTLKRFHPDVTEVVDIASIPDQMRVFDTLKASDVTLIDNSRWFAVLNSERSARHWVYRSCPEGPSNPRCIPPSRRLHLIAERDR